MKRLQWVKLQLDIFDTVKMRYMARQRNGRRLVLFWVMLQMLAGEINDGGALYVSSRIPFTADVLAAHFSLSGAFVDQALDLYEKLDLISREDTGRIQLLTWNEDQETERLRTLREAGRRRTAAYRERQKAAVPEEPEPAVLPEKPAAPVVPAEEAPPAGEEAALPAAVTCYQQAFGMISPGALQALTDAEQDWGSEAVCHAIDIAKYRNISRINYIMAILRNGSAENGKDGGHDGSGNFDEQFSTMLQEASERCRQRELAGGDDGGAAAVP